MYCKLLKLTNGDNLIVSTDDDCTTFKNKEFIDIIDPVQIGTMRFPHGNKIVETYVLQPWLKMGVQDVVRIPTHSIIVAVDIHEKALAQYRSFVEENDKPASSDFDSLTEEEMEEEFDELMDALLNDVTEEDDDGNRNTRPTTTYH
jgi:hypothetical protein